MFILKTDKIKLKVYNVYFNYKNDIIVTTNCGDYELNGFILIDIKNNLNSIIIDIVDYRELLSILKKHLR